MPSMKVLRMDGEYPKGSLASCSHMIGARLFMFTPVVGLLPLLHFVEYGWCLFVRNIYGYWLWFRAAATLIEPRWVFHTFIMPKNCSLVKFLKFKLAVADWLLNAGAADRRFMSITLGSLMNTHKNTPGAYSPKHGGLHFCAVGWPTLASLVKSHRIVPFERSWCQIMHFDCAESEF